MSSPNNSGCRCNIYVTLLTAFILTLFCAPQGNAQRRLPSFDESFRSMRFNVGPGFNHEYDDYLQYSPAAIMLGLKVCGYESRSSWGRMLVSDAFSVAAMAAAVNGVKYSVRRLRPDGSSRNSFPSGHTATSFMVASMLHQEYGWRSPWFSVGAYAVASVTGISRILNDRHWTTDVIAGAVIGIASVKLGYFLADLIFKDRYQASGWAKPQIGFESQRKYYDGGLYFGYRFLLGGFVSLDNGETLRPGGSTAGVEASFPIVRSEAAGGTVGVAAKVGANAYATNNSLSFNTYDFMAGGYWRRPVARLLELDARLLAGYNLMGNRALTSDAGLDGGFAMSAGLSLALPVAENFKIKAFAQWEASHFTAQKPFVSSAVVGGSAAFFL